MASRLEAFAGGSVEFDEFDSVPERTKRHPKAAVGVESDSGINGVEIIGGGGLDDDAFVGPLVVRAIGIEGFVGGKSDGGGVATESGDRIVNEETVAEMDDIRRPEVESAAVVGNCFGNPGR